MSAKRDANRIPVFMGASSVDGSPLPLKVDPATGRLLCSYVSHSGAVYAAKAKSKRDTNFKIGLGGARSDNSEFIPFNVTSPGYLRTGI